MNYKISYSNLVQTYIYFVQIKSHLLNICELLLIFKKLRHLHSVFHANTFWNVP